jgi:Ti-type conjugative transfer relaxase TraA
MRAGRGPNQERPSSQELTREALFTLTERQSFFAERDLVRRLAEAAQGRGAAAAAVRILATEALNSDALVPLGRWKGERQFTTREMLQLEAELLASAKNSRLSRLQMLPELDLSRFDKLSEEQRAAVRHVTATEGAVKVVSGLAGTGKSSLLRVARVLWQEAGLAVWGAALTGKAARGLESSAAIPSVTLARLLPCLTADRSPFRDDSSPLNARTVLVVDEAGMLGTRQMKALVEAVQRTGAKLVLVGDAKQLQPVEAGGPFRALGELLGEARLVQIQRQRDEWARNVVLKFADGAARFALNDLIARGLLSIAETREDSVMQLLDDWRREGATRPEDHLILASHNETVRLLNHAAQQTRLSNGELSEAFMPVGTDSLHVGDRVLFTRNSSLHGVNNGTLGCVTAIKGTRLRVALDDGRSTEFSLADYDHVRLGYAVTTHKAQGITAENVYVLAGDDMQDREITYVQASRARGLTRFYLDRDAAGERLDAIVRQMSASHQKLLAQEIVELGEKQPACVCELER